MGRGRGLIGTPAFGNGAIARQVVARLRSPALLTLRVATTISSRAPNAYRTGPAWSHGIDVSRAALERSMQRPAAVVESDPPSARRLSAAPDFRPPSTAGRHGVASGRDRLASLPGRSVMNRLSTGKTTPSSQTTRVTPNPSIQKLSKSAGIGLEHVRGASTLGRRVLASATPSPAPASAAIEWRHASATAVTMDYNPHSGRAAASTAGASGLVSTAQLAAVVRGRHTVDAARWTNRRGGHAGHAGEVVRTEAQRAGLTSTPAVNAAIARPKTTRSASTTRSMAPEPSSGSSLRRSASAYTGTSAAASGPTSATAFDRRPNGRVRGLSGLVRHFGETSGSVSGQAAETTTATTDDSETGRQPINDAPLDPIAAQQEPQLPLLPVRPVADPLADIDLGLRIADLVGQVLADEARRGGIVVQGAAR